jgi:hypothetical protein
VWGADGALADVTISYPESLEVQMLEWSGRRLPPVSLPEDPAALYHDVLHRMLEAPDLELGFDIQAQGAVNASRQGTLALRSGNRLSLHAEGTFQGQASELGVSSDGVHIAGSPSGATGLDTPARLSAGVVHGFLSRGLLHNLAMLSIGRPLDLSDGTSDGVTLAGFTALPDGEVRGARTRRIGFTLHAGGEQVGEAVLDIDTATGLPVARTQVVHFPQGDMSVTERYELWRPAGG